MTAPRTTPLRRGTAILLLVLYALAIFGGSSGGAPSVITDLGIPDYFLHAAEFAVLGFLASRAVLHLSLKTGWLLLVLVPGLISTLYGASDELHQAFVPERDADYMDILADAVGSFLGAFTYRALLIRHLRRGVKSIPEPGLSGAGEP